MPDNPPFYFLNVYKPEGITSFDVIYRLRKILNIKKIGHSGTLDPMADGVMQIAVGNASRLLEYLDSTKEYRAEIVFGFMSTTLDREGEITKLEKPLFSLEELKNTISLFTGEITQIPPVYSAIKVNGKRLYEIARKNPETNITAPERKVTVYETELIDFKDHKAQIRVKCSKGTYIRTLCDDIAKKLNTRAYLSKLTRTQAGNFYIKDSIKIEQADISKAIDPISAINLPEIKLNENEYNRAKNGAIIEYNSDLNNETVMLTYMDKLVSIGILSDNKVKIKKFFNDAGI